MLKILIALGLVLGLGAVIVLFISGDFLAGAFDLARRTFAPTEIYVGEIPPDKPPDSASAGLNTALIHKSGVSKSAVPDKRIAVLNDKINTLQAQLDAAAQKFVSAKATSSDSISSDSAISRTADSATTSQIQHQIPSPVGEGRVLISEIMAGADGNSNYEFIELYNAGSAPIDLTGWNIKKKTSTGSESSLIAASRFSGKIIFPGKHLLLGNETGYRGSAALDVAWPSSYTLAYTNNSVVLYNGSGGKIEEIFWTEIPKGQSFVRANWDSSQFVLTFSPAPQNSQSQ